MGEKLEELQKQKEDIKILLSTLEEAYNDASITKEHYDEVKGKNQKKLEELNKKIISLEKVGEKPSGEDKESKAEPEKEEKEEPKSKKLKKPRGKPGRPKKEKTKTPPKQEPPSEPTPPSTPPAEPSSEGAQAATPATTPPSEPAPAESDYSGIPQPLTGVAGDEEAVAATTPDKAPGTVKTAEPGTIQYTAQEVKTMLDKLLKEIRPQGLEVGPRVDKLEVQLEKLRAYIEAMKDEKSSGSESIQRLTEEMGEIRSNVSGVDRKISEAEIKVQEIDQSLGDLRPARFLKALQDDDKSIKLHDARLDKLDDLTSVMLKKLGQIEEVLKRLGSLEKIVDFSKEAAKRLLEIENREKKINRIADKIDGIFMELNKRLDEFVLYKAKQDTLDELSQEMMKSMDEINTKIEKYAEKGDLDMLKDMFQTELASFRSSSGTSPEVQRLESQKSEIEGLIAMLDEQFKAGALPEAEYKKTRQINEDRLRDIDKKISTSRAGKELALAAANAVNPEGSPQPEQKTEESSSPPTTEPQPSKEDSGTQGAKPPTGDREETPTDSEPSETPPEEKPKKTPEGPPTKPSKPPLGDNEDRQASKQQSLMAELEDSFMKGLISKGAFDKAKKLIPTKPSKPTKGDKKDKKDGKDKPSPKSEKDGKDKEEK